MGRDQRNERKGEHFTQMFRAVMESPAWRALSPTARALCPWLKMEWHGPKANNNGKLQLSVRQAAERMGVGLNTAGRAFHDLQAKGFLVVTQRANHGPKGDAQSHLYKLTEIILPSGNGTTGRRLYLEWQKGVDFPIQRTNTNNPEGHNGRSATVIELKPQKIKTPTPK